MNTVSVAAIKGRSRLELKGWAFRVDHNAGMVTLTWPGRIALRALRILGYEQLDIAYSYAGQSCILHTLPRTGDPPSIDVVAGR